ncbi:MAG TPA: hypothetical protein VNO26_13060 [Candidatus Limnocylindria bacterium]|nr:hypothetical protein [Candidatus Limnocylindria bacterium]
MIEHRACVSRIDVSQKGDAIGELIVIAATQIEVSSLDKPLPKH